MPIFFFSAAGSTLLTHAWTTNRQVQSSRPSRPFLAEDFIPPYARQANSTDSLSSLATALNQHLGLIRPYLPFSTRGESRPNPSRIPIRYIPTKKHSSHGTNLCGVYLEALPSILVLHLELFLYDVATEGITKVSEPVQIAPELEIPLGIIFVFYLTISSAITRANNTSRPDPEIMATVFMKSAEPALKASWDALLPRRARRQRALYDRCAQPEWKWRS